MEFGLIDTTGMSEQQRREIPYTIVQSQAGVQAIQNPPISRSEDLEATALPRYDDIKTSCVLHGPPIEDETGSVVIV